MGAVQAKGFHTEAEETWFGLLKEVEGGIRRKISLEQWENL
jgi:hypothetical protein